MTRFVPTLLLCFVPSLALAVLPPDAYREARRTAAHHLQVRVDSVSLPARTPGQCRVEGTVVQIFRDRPAALKPDQRVSFGIACSRPGDEVPDGPVLWTRVTTVQNAKYFEIFANPAPDSTLRVARSQSSALQASTPTPTMDTGLPRRE